ncbi:putative calcium-transporting ATPase 13, plasma membrane-type [Coffea eugenioides]|uniref:Calcium-transporting ATPase n=1 Tax=Coffea arabica TaxID=13443 RepID=A0A6P6V8W4_COFAR|nr:putative calcium-transporting ATPase 13, plasma membrane-type [Coffea arabica]XP_027099055.1 putative calcium-transporting ATPase 13, plasma membrane-type [Coffea arabica]XP_027152115.1 putative calcium-transporting ATPase 13, plasma membrane-type [Coffea eugenioides]
MPSIVDANLSCINLVTRLSKLNKTKKKWGSAFLTIYCSKAFKNVLSCRKSKISPVLSDTVIIDIPEVPPSFCNVDQTTLTKLVKEKSLGQLDQLGGIQGIAASLNTEVQHGLNGDDAEDILRRIEAFGSNTYRKPPKKGFFHFVWEAFQDPTIVILLACAALSLSFGIKENGPKEGWYDGGSIFVAVFLVISVSAISNFRQNRQFEKLSKFSSNIPVEVVRNGRRQQISIFEVVVGDVVRLKIGDQVPADGLLLEGHSLSIDESSMTGESDHLEVNQNQNPFLTSGTKVADGYGQMLVTSVGMSTTWGEMMSSVSQDSNEKTPLQSRLNKLTSAIGKVGLAVASLVLLVLLVRYFTGHTKDANGIKEYNGSKTKADDVINAVVKIIAAAVTIVVVAIPEGLPLAVTVTLAYSMKRMMADQAMVRKLSACETMGSATTICTDKTGTLTLNRMTVTKFWLGKESVEKDSYSSISTNVLKLIREAVSLNTTGSVYRPINLGTEGLEFSGSPTEKAILSWAVMELNMEMERVKQNCSILHVEAFNSQKKRSGVLMKKMVDNSIHVHWKGAAEMILAMCSHYYNLEGEVTLLDHLERKKFEEIIQGMAASSLRCIAFAHKKITEANDASGEIQQTLEDRNLILLGIVGLKDPCRPGVKKAVEDCQYAGVKIKMITGDNVFTARAIATECGILKPDLEANDELVVEGVEFRNYTDEERMEKVDKIVVMARSSPFDKHLMVKCLKEKGHVVAVTGDGTNDAPALKEADIGLSMGIQGTEVAKESSDIVILDDNFASVATVLTWGRCVYSNIQKFIQFQLTVNVAALVINFVAAISAGEVPLTAVQLLWVNLIMDTLGALALATERPAKDLMDKPPVGRTEPLITNIMWRNLMSQALYQIAVLLTLQFKGKSIFGVSEKVNDTLIFNTFVLCQVFNEFNARKLERKNVFEGIHRNKLFLGIIGVTIILQVVMVEFLKRFANTERLNWGQWGACIGIAAASWPIGWIIKCIPVPDRPVFSYLKWNNFC